MLFVFDTNTLVSAILKPASIPMQALSTAQAKGQLLFTEETKQELLDIIQRPKFDKYLSLQRRIEKSNSIITASKLILIKDSFETTCRDSTDIKFLQLIVEGGVDCLIRGDFDLKELHPFRNIPILSSSDFLIWVIRHEQSL